MFDRFDLTAANQLKPDNAIERRLRVGHIGVAARVAAWEWRLIDWTVPDDDGQRLPIWADVAGDTGAWGSDYALRNPQDGDWRFPDGERCDDEGLTAAFERRRIKH